MFELLPDGRRIYTDGNHTVQQDALLLAGFVRLRPGLRAADLGCGCGTVGFRLLTRGLESIELVDCSEAACTLARRTAAEGGFAAAVTEADARRWTPARKLDLLVCNPPYFLAGRPSPDPERRRARHNGSFTLDDLGRCARRALRQKGELYVCFPADGIAGLFYHLKLYRLEPKTLQLVCGGGGRRYLALVRAVLDGGPGLTIENDRMSEEI